MNGADTVVPFSSGIPEDLYLSKYYVNDAISYDINLSANAKMIIVLGTYGINTNTKGTYTADLQGKTMVITEKNKTYSCGDLWSNTLTAIWDGNTFTITKPRTAGTYTVYVFEQ